MRGCSLKELIEVEHRMKAANIVPSEINSKKIYFSIKAMV